MDCHLNKKIFVRYFSLQTSQTGIRESKLLLLGRWSYQIR